MNRDTRSIEDIKAIRKIMEDSSRFISLSGLSGLYAGITAIAGALVAAFVTGWGLIFWILGFGILHILYGLAMYSRYEA